MSLPNAGFLPVDAKSGKVVIQVAAAERKAKAPPGPWSACKAACRCEVAS